MPGPKKPADESNQQLKHGKPLTPRATGVDPFVGRRNCQEIFGGGR